MFSDFTEANDPFSLFQAWFDEAAKSESNDPNAMALATVDPNGLPDVRVVLLKGFDERGFVFYTNKESSKGRELAANAKAAANFHWKSLQRQVRVRGPVVSVTDEEADAYYQSRPKISRIGAWASQQSRPLASRAIFEQAVAEFEHKFGDGPIPRPPHWSGFRILPAEIEFWQDRPYRLHDRIVFRRAPSDDGAPGGSWDRQRLYP